MQRAALTLLLAATAASAQAQYQITELGAYRYSAARSINSRGQVAGYSPLTNAGGDIHAVIWEKRVMTDLGTLGGAQSIAVAINARGEVAGSSWFDAAGGTNHAFLWRKGTMQDLGTLGGAASWAFAINDAGRVVGAAFASGSAYRAFIWDRGQMTDLGTLGGVYNSCQAIAINNSEEIVGTCWGMGVRAVPVIWTWNGETRAATIARMAPQLSDAHYISPAAINDDGEVTGWWDTGDPDVHAFVWDGSNMIDLGIGTAAGINARGQVVGYAPLGAGKQHAVLWNRGDGNAVERIDLGTIEEGSDSWGLGINNAGEIVGQYYTGTYEGHAFLATRH